jgi:hypothetical protein
MYLQNLKKCDNSLIVPENIFSLNKKTQNRKIGRRNYLLRM